MNAVSGLENAARGFAALYQANAALLADHADWDCVLRLEANDSPQQVGITIRRGEVQSISSEAQHADLVVTAPLQTLLDILELRLNPNQPYLFGELTLRGDEADFMRIDYLASTLCVQA
jgi:putative sterol carrier protein